MTNLEKYTQVFIEVFNISKEQASKLKYRGDQRVGFSRSYEPYYCLERGIRYYDGYR